MINFHNRFTGVTITLILRVFTLITILLTAACSYTVSPKKSSAVTIKVMSYNIHHANPPSKAKEGLIDIDAIAKVIKDAKPDLVGLQEVDVNTKRCGSIDEAALLAQKTGMYYHFFKAIDHDGGDYGVAILSRYPIIDFAKTDLPQVIKAEARVLSSVTVNIPGTGNITFANTHLDATRLDSNRVVQIKKITEVLNAKKGPVILVGDLNSEAGKATIKILDQTFKRSCIDGCAFTIPETTPNKTIDFVALKNAGWKVIEHQVIPETYASDHRPVTVVYQVK